MLEYNEFAYKKTKDHRKLEHRLQKKAMFQSHMHEITDKKTAYNEGWLYLDLWFVKSLPWPIEIDGSKLSFYRNIVRQNV